MGTKTESLSVGLEEKENKRESRLERIKAWPKHLMVWFFQNLYTILYLIVLAVLGRYIALNWEKCISMQFFSRFDGNNILFLVWIAAIALFFYDIDAKGLKIHRKGIEYTKKQLDDASSVYKLLINGLQNNLEDQKTEKTAGGADKQ